MNGCGYDQGQTGLGALCFNDTGLGVLCFNDGLTTSTVLRNSSGERARVGDLVLIKEAESKLVRDGTHVNMVNGPLDGAVAGDSR